MSNAISLSAAALAAAHQQFVVALPAMENVVRFQLRGLPKWCRTERINDALAACWHAWWGMVRRGKDPVEAGITGIAANACRYVRAGRRLGTGTAGRGAADIHSPRAQRKHGFRLIRLDCHDEPGCDAPSDAWRDWLLEDRRIGPGDLAAIRLDFATWVSGLPERKKAMAELLAEGHETGVVAGMLGVSQGRVSQVRGELESNWKAFHGEGRPAAVAPGPRSAGRPCKAAQSPPARASSLPSQS